MPNTTNFNWPTPADTDLVKDGAAAIRNLGNGIDTSLIDLKGGTTGQILSKASNADMDFTFITPNVGDITEVQAGTGISVASGTGPIPVVTNSMATEITAKGDLIVGTGSGTFDNLPVGTNGHILVADSSTATGLAYAAPAAGGKVLQVIFASTSTATTIASASYADTGVTATITPSSTGSRVLVLISVQYYADKLTGSSPFIDAKLFRGATGIASWNDSDGRFAGIIATGATKVAQMQTQPIMWVDSPSSTSALTYKLQARLDNTNNSATSTFQFGSCPSTITLIEIGA